MRLIDADALKRNFEANTPVFAQDMVPVICYIIDRARTIDAIPVQDGILKARKGDYVTYRIDWLLDYLAQEISLLEGYRRGRKEDG